MSRSSFGAHHHADTADVPGGPGYFERYQSASIKLSTVVVVGVASIAISAGIGSILNARLQRQAFATGACAALDLVAAQGRLTDVERRRAMKAIASPSHPVWVAVPIGHAELRAACAH